MAGAIKYVNKFNEVRWQPVLDDGKRLERRAGYEYRAWNQPSWRYVPVLYRFKWVAVPRAMCQERREFLNQRNIWHEAEDA